MRHATGPVSMWSYADSLPAGPPSMAMGEQATPLVEVAPGVSLKHEQTLPTGSFKARGSAVMVGLAQSLGVEAMVVDSSGNGGLAAAAYAEAASIPVEVFLPETTDPAKVAAIEGHGAVVRLVSGDRQAAAASARARVESSGAWYASHVYQPAFHHGVKTLAFELIDSDGETPHTVVVPAGNGTLVIGLWLGFRELLRAGRLAATPRIVGVQAARCAPLAGLAPSGASAATGITIAHPPRLGQVRAAITASRGAVLTVSEEEIASAVEDLSRRGTEVSATGAVAWAAWLRAPEAMPGQGSRCVVVLTGSS
jgi:threonine synthase